MEPTKPAEVEESGPDAENRRLALVLLDIWRMKVRWVTAACVATVFGLMGAVIAPLGVIPLLGTALSAMIAGAAAVVAVPVGVWVASRAVPAMPDSTPSPKKAGSNPLAQILMDEAMRQAAPGLTAWSMACVVLSKGSPGAASMLAFAAVGMGASSAIPFGLGVSVSGFCVAAGFLAKAMWKPMPLLPPGEGRPDPAVPEEAKKQAAEEAKEAKKRPDGLAILEALRESPAYRGQDSLVLKLGGAPRATGDGLKRLLSRFQRLTPEMLAGFGITDLTSSQTAALDAVLAAEKSGAASDWVLVGWAGSGRSTFCNLLALGAVANGEGTVYCVAAEGPNRHSTSRAGAGAKTGAGRGASSQLHGWLKSQNWGGRLQEAYVDQPDSRLSLAKGPDVVFTDVRLFGEDILGKASGDARGLLQRLRYVVIDHPDRLSREDLVRLRIAIARLRMTARLYGRGNITFLVMLPRIGNHAELAKWLLNNEAATPHLFDAWYPPANLLAWVPPQEFVQRGGVPMFARADFKDELVSMLTEFGVQAHKLRLEGLDPMRIGVIDARPLLGPEFRAHLDELVLTRLKETVEEDTFKFVQDWTCFGTADLRIDKEFRFDVLVTVGVGGHPEHLVSSLRSLLAEGGLLVLFADASPIDHESLRRIQEPGWDPLDAVRLLRYPNVVLPHHAEAVVAHELASLFSDFRDRKVPRRQLADIFPGEAVERLICRWKREGLLTAVEVFELADGEAGEIQRAEYLHQGRDGGIRADLYEVPWGCSTRHVWEIYDDTARSVAKRVGRNQSTFVDKDRIFIDLHPSAMLRYAPNTVEVVNLVPVAVSPAEAAGDRFVRQGQIHVQQVHFQVGVSVDKRALRLRVDLLAERAFGGPPVIADGHALSEVVLCTPDQRGAMASLMLHPSAASGGKTPALRLAGGTWIGTMKETVRDVVKTDGRLVEDHRLLEVTSLPAHARAERSFETVLTVCAFERGKGAAGDAVDAALAGDRAAHLAVARVLGNILSAGWLDFDREYRVTVVPCVVHGRHPAWASVVMPSGEKLLSGFAACAEVAARVVRKVNGDGPVRSADMGHIVHLWAWVRENVAPTDSVVASVSETLRARSGCAESRAVTLATLAASLGAPACAVCRGGHWFVEVGVPAATRATHVAALRTGGAAVGLSGMEPATREADGVCWFGLDPANELVSDVVLNGREEARRIIPSNPFTDWRIVIYRPRSGEIDAYDQIGASFSREFAPALLPACLDLLGACECEDGCSSCCGGLGTVPAASVKTGAYNSEAFDDIDVISRLGAVRLLSALVGRAPEATTTHTSTPRGAGDLQGLVAQAIGTKGGLYENGIWSKLFGGHMALAPAWVAPARWMKGEEGKPRWTGFYRSGPDHVVVIKKNDNTTELLHVLIHEYTHNWQYSSGKFDHERLARSDDAKQFFAEKGYSNFIIEGHATWAGTQFSFSRGSRAVYIPSDPQNWDEYKTGYILIEGIVKAFGVSGLFRWLSPTPDVGPTPKSRNKRLTWPFTINDAVVAFGLEEEARNGVFDGVDVEVPEGAAGGEGLGDSAIVTS